MPDARRRTCKVCRRHDSEVGPISWSGLCADDARARMHANNDSIHLKQGEGFDRRRYGIALKEYGPRVALALKQAGVFESLTVDTSSPSP